jgi:glycosyltransferase involved in cell wall biosynthesis
MRLTAFTRYGRKAASTRQRLLQYVPHLAAAGIEVDWHPLLSDEYVDNLASGRGFSRMEVATAYLKRMRDLVSRQVGDAVWVYAELFPYLPGWFETLAFRAGKPVIYDFDDAFFHNYDAHPNALVRRILGGKFQPLLTGAAAACCGNSYLEDYAARFCRRTMVLPTVVDTGLYLPVDRPGTSAPVIGWIGSPSTWSFMRPLLPLLAELAQSHGVRVKVIGAGKAAEEHRFPGLEIVDWHEDREIADVQSLDIGIMPLPDERWARGKSGYKLIQYMACGLPVVASPVGVNEEIVTDGVNGLLVRDVAEWRTALLSLIENTELRRRLGEAGRRRALDHYSLEVHAPRLAELIRSQAVRR